MNCPNCGNKLFDQGFTTLYCGACNTFHNRRRLELTDKLQALFASQKALWIAACESTGQDPKDCFVAYSQTPEWEAYNDSWEDIFDIRSELSKG